MIQLIRTTKSKRPRDRGRPVLIIGEGKGKRVFHLAEYEVEKLREDLSKLPK